jgi:hypothetical protein
LLFLLFGGISSEVGGIHLQFGGITGKLGGIPAPNGGIKTNLAESRLATSKWNPVLPNPNKSPSQKQIRKIYTKRRED